MAAGAIGTALGEREDRLMVLEENPSQTAAERALILRARAGDAGAFDQLMILRQRQVLNTAWRLLGQVEDAKDAAQEVFLRLYRSLSRIDAERDLRAWLYRVTVNVCNDLGNRRRRPETISLEVETEKVDALPARDDEMVVRIDRAAQLRLIQRALGTLSPKERAALVLRDIEGLTSEEVAQVLGTSSMTVRSQISSARMKIKRYRERILRRRI